MSTAVEDISDSEVSAVFQSSAGLQSVINTAMLQANALKAAGGTNTTQYVIELDRSDDEESDHTSDLYPALSRGRVSPSPYTANTERARRFNAYVRGIIEDRLNVLVPISHQPRDLVTDIIADASVKFPEFASCVRKRIRTFLKSYRRSKKLRDCPTTNGINKMDDNDSPSPEESVPETSSTSITTDNNTGVVTLLADVPTSNEDYNLSLPPLKIPRLSSSSLPSLYSYGKSNNHTAMEAGLVVSAATASAVASGRVHNTQSLNNHEVLAVKQLIAGYRESAAFLQRAADQLEDMLHKNSAT